MTPSVLDFDGFARRITSDRVLPHNLEAERAILGAILLHGDVLPVATAIVHPADFFRDAHRRIFIAMTALHTRGTDIDFVTLRHLLEETGHLDAVGGPVYLTSLVDGLPRSTNVDAYARIVNDLAHRRQIIAAATKIATAAYDAPDQDLATLTALAQHDFARVNAGTSNRGLDPAFLHPASQVIAEGQQIERDGIPYLVDGMIPSYGGVGMLVAATKVGKTTFGQAMAGAVASGRPFLDRPTTQRRVLMVCAEDPPEYVAYLARHLTVTDEQLTFYRAPVLLDPHGLRRIVETVQDGGYGFVLIASWQAVIRGLLERGENDNAGAANIVEMVKQATRPTKIPWLIDAHAGKGENQADDADPTMALRGATGAAAAADYILSLRYANGAFGTQRRLSGKGRFVNIAPLTLDYDPQTGRYTSLGSTKDAMKETTWRLIVDMNALDTTLRSATEIARRCGLIGEADKLSGQQRKQITAALAGREEVGRTEAIPPGGGHKTTLYRRLEVH